MRWLALVLCLLAASGLRAGEPPRLERLAQPPPGGFDAVRAANDGDWLEVAEGALRRQPGASWWRVRLPASTGGGEPRVLALKEAYDAELVAYVAPDFRPQRLATFDSDVPQVGSRHRLAVTVPAAALDQPVYLELRGGRAQPIRLAGVPLSQYLAEDALRVRITSALLSAQLLLGVVAAIFAFALRRRMLLLFSVWVASSVLYQMVMSGEITMLMPGSALLPHAMRINSIAINVGLVCAYGFMVWFLAIPRHYPRLTWVFLALLAGCLLALAGALVDPANGLFLALNNMATMMLAALTLAVGVARARAGSPQGWFYLVGWGSVSLVGFYRAGLFLNQRGTPDWLEVAHPTINAFGALVLVLATARAARYAEREMHAAREVARTDPLTGLPNRSQLDRGLAALLESCRSTGQPMSLVFLDLDHFKSINDRFGHRVGDACLAASAQILKSQVRTTDLLARYGGEEFILVLPGASPEHAAEIAEAARAAIERQAREVDGCAVALTVSIGIAAWQPGEPVAELIARADAALYRAKREGRNRVVDAARTVAPRALAVDALD